MQLLDQEVTLDAEQLLELDDAVGELVHRHAEQQVCTERCEVELDPGLGSGRLDEAVRLVDAGDERSVGDRPPGCKSRVGGLELRLICAPRTLIDVTLRQ
jgi:hypothetical protein